MAKLARPAQELTAEFSFDQAATACNFVGRNFTRLTLPGHKREIRNFEVGLSASNGMQVWLNMLPARCLHSMHSSLYKFIYYFVGLSAVALQLVNGGKPEMMPPTQTLVCSMCGHFFVQATLWQEHKLRPDVAALIRQVLANAEMPCKISN